MTSAYRDRLSAFNEAGVRYLVVGAAAFIEHAEPRVTKDFGVWVEPTPENAARVWRALAEFGAPLAGIRPEDFGRRDTIYQIGVPPVRIDVVTSIEAVRFPTAWRNRRRGVYQGVQTGFLGLRELIRNKRAVGRPQDLADVAALETRGRPPRRRRRR